MELSIIIVNWNIRDVLAQCLESVWEDVETLGTRNAETFVVDNASRDDTAQMVRERFPWVRLIENGENMGFAWANNQAIRQSSGRYVLLLNPDTKVKRGALGTLVRFMDEHPEAGAAGARLLNPDGTLQVSCHPAPTLRRELWRLFHLDAIYPYAAYPVTDWDLETPRTVDVVQGACLILRRTVLDQAGLLDEEYFIYSEEVDLCRRVRQAGWPIYWVPQARVVHYGGQSTQQVAGEMFLCLYQGKVLYFRKHYGRWAAQVYKIIVMVAALTRLLLSLLAWLEPPPQRARHLALTGNYWRLLWALARF